MAQFISLADFSRLIGVSQQAVYAYKKKGRIVLKDGLVDVDASTKRLKETSDPVKGKVIHKALGMTDREEIPPDFKNIDDNAALSYRAYRAVKIKHESRLVELDVEERVKNLIPRDIVEYCLHDYIMAFVAVLNNWPDQIAPRMLGFTDIHEARQFMENEIDILKQTLHDSVSRCHANLAE